MTASDLLLQAKQGNPKAIAALLNRQLAPRGFRIQAKREGSLLVLLVTSATTPEQAKLTTYLAQSFQKLASPQVEQLRIYGKAHDQEKPAWIADIPLQAAEISPPLPPSPPAVPTLPKQPFLQQWVVFNLVAGVGVWLSDRGGDALLGNTGIINELLVSLVGALLLGGAQTYVLARRLPNAHWWFVASSVAVFLPFQALKPVQGLAGLITLGLQCVVLRRVCDRAYWWFLGNLLAVISLGAIYAILGFFGPLGILLRLLGMGQMLMMLFMTLMLMIQGVLLKSLLEPLPDRPVLPLEAYFRATLPLLWQVGRDRLQSLQPSPKRKSS